MDWMQRLRLIFQLVLSVVILRLQPPFKPRTTTIRELNPKIPYASCQGQFGESNGSKDARNPNTQKAANPSAMIDAGTRANADRPNNTRVVRKDTTSTPTTISSNKVIGGLCHGCENSYNRLYLLKHRFDRFYLFFAELKVHPCR